MARVIVTPTTVASLASISVKIADLTAFTADKMEFYNTGDACIVLHNSDASPRTVTLLTTASVNGVSYAPHVETLAAGDHKILGYCDAAILNVSGKVQVDPEAGSEALLSYKVLKLRNL